MLVLALPSRDVRSPPPKSSVARHPSPKPHAFGYTGCFTAEALSHTPAARTATAAHRTNVGADACAVRGLLAAGVLLSLATPPLSAQALNRRIRLFPSRGCSTGAPGMGPTPLRVSAVPTLNAPLSGTLGVRGLRGSPCMHHADSPLGATSECMLLGPCAGPPRPEGAEAANTLCGIVNERVCRTPSCVAPGELMCGALPLVLAGNGKLASLGSAAVIADGSAMSAAVVCALDGAGSLARLGSGQIPADGAAPAPGTDAASATDRASALELVTSGTGLVCARGSAVRAAAAWHTLSTSPASGKEGVAVFKRRPAALPPPVMSSHLSSDSLAYGPHSLWTTATSGAGPGAMASVKVHQATFISFGSGLPCPPRSFCLQPWWPVLCSTVTCTATTMENGTSMLSLVSCFSPTVMAVGMLRYAMRVSESTPVYSTMASAVLAACAYLAPTCATACDTAASLIDSPACAAAAPPPVYVSGLACVADGGGSYKSVWPLPPSLRRPQVSALLPTSMYYVVRMQASVLGVQQARGASPGAAATLQKPAATLAMPGSHCTACTDSLARALAPTPPPRLSGPCWPLDQSRADALKQTGGTGGSRASMGRRQCSLAEGKGDLGRCFGYALALCCQGRVAGHRDTLEYLTVCGHRLNAQLRVINSGGWETSVAPSFGDQQRRLGGDRRRCVSTAPVADGGGSYNSVWPLPPSLHRSQATALPPAPACYVARVHASARGVPRAGVLHAQGSSGGAQGRDGVAATLPKPTASQPQPGGNGTTCTDSPACAIASTPPVGDGGSSFAQSGGGQPQRFCPRAALLPRTAPGNAWLAASSPSADARTHDACTHTFLPPLSADAPRTCVCDCVRACAPKDCCCCCWLHGSFLSMTVLPRYVISSASATVDTAHRTSVRSTSGGNGSAALSGLFALFAGYIATAASPLTTLAAFLAAFIVTRCVVSSGPFASARQLSSPWWLLLLYLLPAATATPLGADKASQSSESYAVVTGVLVALVDEHGMNLVMDAVSSLYDATTRLRALGDAMMLWREHCEERRQAAEFIALRGQFLWRLTLRRLEPTAANAESYFASLRELGLRSVERVLLMPPDVLLAESTQSTARSVHFDVLASLITAGEINDAWWSTEVDEHAEGWVGTDVLRQMAVRDRCGSTGLPQVDIRRFKTAPSQQPSPPSPTADAAAPGTPAPAPVVLAPVPAAPAPFGSPAPTTSGFGFGTPAATSTTQAAPTSGFGGFGAAATPSGGFAFGGKPGGVVAGGLAFGSPAPGGAKPMPGWGAAPSAGGGTGLGLGAIAPTSLPLVAAPEPSAVEKEGAVSHEVPPAVAAAETATLAEKEGAVPPAVAAAETATLAEKEGAVSSQRAEPKVTSPPSIVDPALGVARGLAATPPSASGGSPRDAGAARFGSSLGGSPPSPTRKEGVPSSNVRFTPPRGYSNSSPTSLLPPGLGFPPCPSPSTSQPVSASSSDAGGEGSSDKEQPEAVGRKIQLALLPSQNRRSAVHAWLSVLQADAGDRLRLVPRRVWAALSFALMLRRRALASPAAAARRSEEAERQRILQLTATEPRPIIGFDVGFDESSGAFSFRSPLGEVSATHPRAKTGMAVPAYSADGRVVKPMWPPPESSWVLVPEASGGWCYYDTAYGSSSWFPPAGASHPTERVLPCAPEPFDEPPPPLHPQLSFGTVDREGWLPLYQDSSFGIILRHELTGATRSAPWISLRTVYGRVFFANLLTRQTRWFPPHRWMDEWIDRGSRLERWMDKWQGSVYSRKLLPWSVARMRVEGGAPYLHAYGTPQYRADSFDSTATHPSCAA